MNRFWFVGHVQSVLPQRSRENGRMRIVALQPWNDGSHKAVRDSIERHSTHDWHWFSLPGGEIRWRMRLGAARLIHDVIKSDVLGRGCDSIFCTGLLDVAQLRALLPAEYRSIPITVYMHENQLVYPSGPRMKKTDVERDGHLAATNISSLLAADRVIFNSEFNRTSCLDSMPEFLSLSRTSYPVSEWQDRIMSNSTICWPPVEPIPDAVLRNTEQPHYQDFDLVGWPHRFEHDKGPDELLELMDRRPLNDLMKFSLFGQRYEEIPQELEAIRNRHAEKIVCDQWFDDRDEYLQELARCGWVLSTARHEFFGIAVVEAMLCGCLPWLPDRLSYPELLPPGAQGLSPLNPPKDPGRVREDIRRHLEPALASNSISRLDQLLETPPEPGPKVP